MALTAKFVSMANHFILLWFNLFDLGVARERWYFEHSCVRVVGLFVDEGC